MNADAYMLLTTILHDRPCIDPSLQTAIDTTPFAILSIVQQCYYVLHMVSVTRALLYNDHSAYAQTVQRLVEKLPEDGSGEAVRPQLPSAQPRCITPLATPCETEESTAKRPHSEGKASILQRRPMSSHSGLSSSPQALETMTEKKAEQSSLEHPSSSRSRTSLSPLLPVLPACSLDVSVTIVGGGTVSRALLHLLLDQHPSLLHPTRITVITRQPEKLNLFASRGVLCLHRKYGTEALNFCHVLILACQPGAQLEDFIENHFSAKAYGNDPLHQVAHLKPSTVVISCLAAYPITKLAAQLHHDERLILRTHVSSITMLPEIGEEYVAMARNSMALCLQKTADEDSFLKKAVREAERHRIELAVEKILETQYRSKSNDGSLAPGEEDCQKIPEDLARRAALYAAVKEDRARMQPTDPMELLMENSNAVTDEFLMDVWAAIQAYVRSEFDVREKEKARRVQALRMLQGEGPLIPFGSSSSSPAVPLSVGIAKRKEGKAEAQSAAKQSEGPFLCAALAMLPPSAHVAVVDHLVFRYRPPTPNNKFLPSERRSGQRNRRLTSVVSSSFQSTRIGLPGAGSSAETLWLALRRLASVYSDETSFTDDLRLQYREVVKAEPGTELEKIV